MSVLLGLFGPSAPNMSVLLGLLAHGSKHVRFVGLIGPRFETCLFCWRIWPTVRRMSVLLVELARNSKHVCFVGPGGPRFEKCSFCWVCCRTVRNMSVWLRLLVHDSKHVRFVELVALPGSKHVRFVGPAGPPFKACPFGWTCWSVVRNMSVLLALVAHGSKSSRMRDLITRTSSRLPRSLRPQYSVALDSPAQASRLTSPDQQINLPRQAHLPRRPARPADLQVHPSRAADFTGQTSMPPDSPVQATRITCPGQQIHPPRPADSSSQGSRFIRLGQQIHPPRPAKGSKEKSHRKAVAEKNPKNGKQI